MSELLSEVIPEEIDGIRPQADGVVVAVVVHVVDADEVGVAVIVPDEHRRSAGARQGIDAVFEGIAVVGRALQIPRGLVHVIRALAVADVPGVIGALGVCGGVVAQPAGGVPDIGGGLMSPRSQVQSW